MSNQNTVVGVYNLPGMALADTNIHALTVPPNGATAGPTGVTWGAPYYTTAYSNQYPGFPSPALPVNSALTLTVPQDLAAGGEFDGRPFKIRCAFGASNSTGNLLAYVYQVNQSVLGTIGTSGSVTTAGAPGATNTATTGTVTLTSAPATSTAALIEWTFLWDSTSKLLVGEYQALYTSTATGTVITATATTTLTSITAANLNFLVAFKSGGTGTITVQDFVIDRL